MKYSNKKESGFTLVELSIVLVIIGLIVSGVLVGQDLIAQARLRSQITQIGQFDAAANAFYTKYDSYPGDLPSPLSYGLVVADPTGAGSTGNGLIEGEMANGAAIEEAEIAFETLSGAGMIPGSLAADEFPLTKMNVGNIGVFNLNSKNYWAIGTDSTTASTWSAGFSSFDAWSIDTKIDDGVYNDGIVLAAQTAGTTIQASGLGTVTAHATNPVCVDSDDANYAVRYDDNAQCPLAKLMN